MNSAAPKRFRVGELAVDLTRATAGDEVLTEQDCALLGCLAARQQGIVSKGDLYRDVWGYHSMPRGRALDFAIRRLREKIEPDATQPVFLTTERGRGFRLRWSPWIEPQADALSLHLPVARTAWIGEADSVEALKSVLAKTTRLICLHGPAGVGKTRLLIEVFARREAPIWIRGAAEPDAWSLFTVLGKALGTGELPLGGDLEEQCSDLVAAVPDVQEGPVLIVDGAQAHVATLCALLPLLLAKTQWRVVLSSQIRLGLPEETVFVVKPLDDAAAVHFLETKLKANAVSGDLGAAELLPLVRQLDGLPLALELAAPRLRALDPVELANRLREGRGSLSHSNDGVSLRGLVQDAVARLPGEQQAAIDLLSAFPYGLTLGVAEQVLSPFGEPLNLLSALMDHSLVHRTSPNNGPPRFRTLWVVARARGEGQGSEAREIEVDRALAQIASRWAEHQAEQAVHRPGQGVLRHALRGEFGHANVWVQSLLRQKEPSLAAELALAFAHLMSWYGQTREALGVLQRTADSLDSKKERCRLFSVAAELGASLQDVGAVDGFLGQVALDGFEDSWCQGRWALAALTVAIGRSQFERAEALLEQARENLRDDPWLIGRVDRMEHSLFALLGQLEDGKSVLEDLRVHAEAADDDWLRVKHAISQGFHAFSEGCAEDAVFCYRRALPLAIQLGHREMEAGLHRRLALALQAAGDEEGGRRSRLRALDLTNPDDNPDVQAHLMASEAEYLVTVGNVEAACEMARRACLLSLRGTQHTTTMSCLRDCVVVGLAVPGEYPFYGFLEELENRGVEREANPYSVTPPFVRGMLALRAGGHEKALRFAKKAFLLCEPFLSQMDGIYLMGQLCTLAAEAGDVKLSRHWLKCAKNAYPGESWAIIFDEDAWYQRARLKQESDA
jgi:DNA-binding winged helix-turn-helix (wHTH) protein